jgi:hypothetical protein
MAATETKAKRQTRATEALGRGFLISHLVKEGIGVSLPLWDDGIDLIVHAAGLDDQEFMARPLQLKVSTSTYVGLYEKYNRTPQTRMVFVWLNDAIETSRIFVMPYAVLYKMFSDHGHLQTPSWINQRGFSTPRASAEKLAVMANYECVTNKRTLKELLF